MAIPPHFKKWGILAIRFMRHCKNCNKKVTGRTDRLFCSIKCQTRHNSRRYYQKHKSDPEFKAKRQKQVNDWISKHLERFNELCRKNNLEPMRKRRKLWKRLGLCHQCGREIDRYDRLTCSRHYVPINKN